MKAFALMAAAALTLGGCTTTPQLKSTADLVNKDTRSLCRIALSDTDQTYRVAAAKLAVRRGATLQKCQRLIAADNAIMTGIAIAGAATAVGVAANNGYYYPSYSNGYGVAWDRFPNGQWRCRDRATGRFVADYRCGGTPFYDAWP